MSDDRFLSPIVVQLIGAALVIVGFVFWIFTERESALFVGAGLTLIAYEAGRGAIRTVRAARQPPKASEDE